jgi:hypothetical protein
MDLSQSFWINAAARGGTLNLSYLSVRLSSEIDIEFHLTATLIGDGGIGGVRSFNLKGLDFLRLF